MSGMQSGQGCKVKLRYHQQQAITLAQKMRGGELTDAIAWVVPGGGKSWLPALMLRELGDAWKIAWFAPRINLSTQAEQDTLSNHGITIRKSGNDVCPERDTRGFVTTHACLTSNPELWINALKRGKWLLVFDELHHAYIKSNHQSSELAAALSRLPYSGRLLMTGTLERNDPTQTIYGVDYDVTRTGLLPSSEVAIRYDRSLALSENAIVPVTFEHHNGPVKWDSLKTDQLMERQLSRLSADEESAGLMTAIETEMAKELLGRGLADWARQRNGKAIVVCAWQEQAKQMLEVAKRYGPSVVAVSKDGEQAQENIQEFRKPSGPRILLTVAMAYEGLDVPEITHGVCLTYFRSTPWIEQMLARAWRKTKTKNECFWWVPDDPRMNRTIQRIRTDQLLEVRRPGSNGNGSGGAGPGARDFVPHSSQTTEIRLSGLDGEAAYTAEQREVLAFLQQKGLDTGCSEVRAVIELLKYKAASEPSALTQSELESRYRKELQKHNCRIAEQYKLEHSHIGQIFKEQMGGRPAKDATIEQLRKAIRYAEQAYPTR